MTTTVSGGLSVSVSGGGVCSRPAQPRNEDLPGGAKSELGVSESAWQGEVHRVLLASLERKNGETAEGLRQALGYANVGSIYSLRQGSGRVSAGALVRLVRVTGDRRLRAELLGLMGAVPETGPAVPCAIERTGAEVREAVGLLLTAQAELEAAGRVSERSRRREAMGLAWSALGAVMDRVYRVRAAINRQTERDLAVSAKGGRS